MSEEEAAGKPGTALPMEIAGSLLSTCPNASSRKGCMAAVHRAVEIYRKPHVCKLNIGSFYHQMCTTCKHELCKTINCRILRGSSCRSCLEDTASHGRGSPWCSVSEPQHGHSHQPQPQCSPRSASCTKQLTLHLTSSHCLPVLYGGRSSIFITFLLTTA